MTAFSWMPSPWEHTPLLLRWKGRYRRRASQPIWFLGFHVDSKRVWEYSDAPR